MSCACPEGKRNSDENKINPKLSFSTEESKLYKNEGKMRIFFYGENILAKLNLPNYGFEISEVENGIKYKKITIFELNWEYYIFSEINEESNKIIAEKIRNNFLNSDFYDVIIVTVTNLLEEKSKLFFKYFQNFSQQISSQPFILFLTKEDCPKIETLYEYITNDFLDKRTLFALKYPDLAEDVNSQLVLDCLFKFRNYYNEQGDLFEMRKENILTDYFKMNLLVCGKSGTGKSTFINKILGERKAKEGEGLSITHKIVRFTHPNFPLNFHDTPGFEDEQTVKDVIKHLDNYNKILIDARKKINLIIYIFEYSERSIYNFEIPLLKRLTQYNAEIIFVINFVTDSIEKKKYKKIQKIYQDDLLKILGPNFNIKLFPINLYKQVEEDEDSDKEIVKKEFGMDVLLNGIYTIFEPMKIDTNSINKIKNIHELFEFLRGNKMFDHFKQVNDFFISYKTEMINLILNYGRKNFLEPSNKEKNMRKLADLIYEKYTGEKCDIYEEIVQKLVSDEIINDSFKKISNEIDVLKSLNKFIHTEYIFNHINDRKTIALGYLCLYELENKLKSNPNVFYEHNTIKFGLIKNLCNSTNEAIESFKLMSQHFINLYKKEKENDNKKIKQNKETKDSKLEIEDEKIEIKAKEKEKIEIKEEKSEIKEKKKEVDEIENNEISKKENNELENNEVEKIDNKDEKIEKKK